MGIMMEVRPVHSENAPFPMEVTESGIDTVVKLDICGTIAEVMVCDLAAITSIDKLGQLENVWSPTDERESGIVMVVRFSQPEKA